jgi:hypothetical protein
MAALQLGLVSSNNEPFVVYGFDMLQAAPGYEKYGPAGTGMIWVSQQRGRTDIVFASFGEDIGPISWCDLFLTSPSGELKEACDYCASASPAWHRIVNESWALKTFQYQTNFWSEKLGIIKAKSDEPKK